MIDKPAELKPWIVRPNEAKDKIPVQAAKLTAADFDKVAAWCSGTADVDAIALKTIHGVQFAELGDWIIKAPDGSFRIATEAQLHRSYEAATR